MENLPKKKNEHNFQILKKYYHQSLSYLLINPQILKLNYTMTQF